MTTMPMGPAPTLEQLLLQMEQMRRGGQGPLASMFQQQGLPQPEYRPSSRADRWLVSPEGLGMTSPLDRETVPGGIGAKTGSGTVPRVPNPYAFGQHSAPV